MRGTVRNSTLKIGRHAHGQYRKAVALGELCEKLKMRLGGFIFGGDAHEALNGITKSCQGLFDKGIGFIAWGTEFLWFVARIDLDVKPRQTANFLRCFLQSAHKRRAVERFNDIGKAASIEGFIGLEAANNMKREVWKSLPERGEFGRGFLDAVFTKEALASVKSGFNGR